MDKRARPAAGFTLIEVLVVVAIIALLIAILMPSLARARFQSRVVLCASQLHQIGIGIMSYAGDQRVIPCGPAVDPLGTMLEGNDGTLATNQVWTGPQSLTGDPPGQPRPQLMALGLIKGRSTAAPEVMYCPGDDSSDPVEELAKINLKKMAPGYCSYLYRQLDETNGSGRIEALGLNSRGGKARALALDMNSLITFDPLYYRTNHKAERVNILFIDGAVRALQHRDRRFAIRDEDLAADPSMATRRDEILQNADMEY